jgi:CHASE2 domain-containing sensor protein
MKKSALATILAISALTLIATRLGLLQGFENAALDGWIRFRPLSQPRETLLIDVTDDDYRDYFGERSPLDSTRLGEILSAIVAGHPRVIGVDVEADPAKVSAHMTVDPETSVPPIIWGGTGRMVDGRVAVSSRTQRTMTGVPWGLTLFPQDSDGVVRYYQRFFALDPRGEIASFPRALVDAYCDGCHDGAQCPTACATVPSKADAANFVLINFAADRYDFNRLSVAQLLQAARGRGWAESGLATGRIVLIGSAYQDARDEYVTPVGSAFGLDLHAQAIATDLRDSGISAVNEFLMLAVEIAGGLFIVFLYRRFQRQTAFRLSLVTIPVVAMASSAVAFYSLSRWANFIPVLFAALIHQLYEAGAQPHHEQPPRSHAYGSLNATVPRPSPRCPNCGVCMPCDSRSTGPVT